MKKELKLFFTALMFYTRIPVPKNTGFSPDNLNNASKYFPLIGIIVGSAGAIVFLFANYFLSVHSSVLFSMLSMILLTGSFHEDAISDFSDGFGGGYTKERILEIMKDSHIGTYGAVSLILLLLLKLFLLSEIEVAKIPLVIVAAHALSRVNPLVLMYSLPYVREDALSKSKPVGKNKSYKILLVGLCIGILPMYFLPLWAFPFIVLVLAAVFIYFRYYVRKSIGGFTGDILGALQQISEVGFYVSFIFFEKILCNYI